MQFGAETWTIIGTLLAVGLGLATLIMRSTGRLDRRIDQANEKADADRRAFQAEAAADRRESDAKMAAFRAEATADRRESDAKMAAFRAEMQRLAERQSVVEGGLEMSRNTAAAD